MTETTPGALRGRIAAAVRTVPIKYGSDTIEPVSTEEAHVLAEVVLADLLGPIPADIDTATWTAIRAIQFMNEAEQRAEAHRLALSTALRLDASANWEALRDRAQDVVAETGDLEQQVRRLGLMVDEYGQGASALTNKLRRVRDRHRETCILARGEVKPTAFECGMCEILDAPAAPVSDAQVAVQLDPLEVRARAVREQQRAQHRAEALTEAADFLPDAHFREGLSVQEIGTAMRHWADRERADAASGPGGVAGETQQPVCVCGAPIEWMDVDVAYGSGWIHSPGSDTPCLDAREAQQDETQADCNSGVGWYEVIHPRNATTCIAYAHEDGSLYLPEGDDLTPDEFAFAAARGNAHRLVRADDPAAVSQPETEA